MTTLALTKSQAQAITTFVQGSAMPLGNGVSVPYPRLEQTLGVKTEAQAQAIAAEALRMTGHTDDYISDILALPQGASIGELIGQDLTGALLAFGGSELADGDGDGDGAGEGDGDGDGSSGKRKGEAGKAAGAAGATAAAAGVAGAGSILSGLGFFTSTAFWKGIGLCIGGGLILIFAALEFYKMSG